MLSVGTSIISAKLVSSLSIENWVNPKNIASDGHAIRAGMKKITHRYEIISQMGVPFWGDLPI